MTEARIEPGFGLGRRTLDMFRIMRFKTAVGLAALTLLSATPTNAQSLGACRVEIAANPPRKVLLCGAALTIEAEEEARFRVRGKVAAGHPEGVSVSDGAVLINVKPDRHIRFQVLTPHALAAVRGTVYAVDVQQAETAVFVARGRVTVTQRGSRAIVTLEQGQGVDVGPGRPLEVKTWGAERVSKLMARFGR
jgi:ferric-dicitrate binding protein FerR (iron transport regulator)